MDSNLEKKEERTLERMLIMMNSRHRDWEKKSYERAEEEMTK